MSGKIEVIVRIDGETEAEMNTTLFTPAAREAGNFVNRVIEQAGARVLEELDDARLLARFMAFLLHARLAGSPQTEWDFNVALTPLGRTPKAIDFRCRSVEQDVSESYRIPIGPDWRPQLDGHLRTMMKRYLGDKAGK